MAKGRKYNISQKAFDSVKMGGLRLTKGWSQREMAEMLGTSRGIITNWENNITEPNLHQVKMLAKIFNVSLEALMGDPNGVTIPGEEPWPQN